MNTLTLETLVDWSESNSDGLIAGFSHGNFKTVVYFLREFSVPTDDPRDELEGVRLGEFLVVGKRWFVEDVVKGMGIE